MRSLPWNLTIHFRRPIGNRGRRNGSDFSGTENSQPTTIHYAFWRILILFTELSEGRVPSSSRIKGTFVMMGANRNVCKLNWDLIAEQSREIPLSPCGYGSWRSINEFVLNIACATSRTKANVCGC